MSVVSYSYISFSLSFKDEMLLNRTFKFSFIFSSYGTFFTKTIICFTTLLPPIRCALPIDCTYVLPDGGKDINTILGESPIISCKLILIPPALICEINILDYGVFLFNDLNYYSKINTLSIMLNGL